MQKLRVDEVMPLDAYERERTTFRAKVIAHKKQRRVLLGPEMSLVFEDRLTVLNQVLEMVRAEKITRPEAIADEVAVYNELVPEDGSLSATLMIEVVDAAQRALRQRDYMGLEKHLHLELDGARTTGVFDPRGLEPDQIAVVQYVSFAVGVAARDALLDLSKPAAIVCTHPRYGYRAELTADTRRSLADDLRTSPASQ
ncbi:MAG: DUF3501 family protein [Myxococcales bacterium]|nr:DUF3501 family protein [Myxococcales bacterium]